MTRPIIAEALNAAGAMKTPKEKIEALQRMANPAVLTLLRLAIDPEIIWELPEGTPPYKTSQMDEPAILYGEVRRMYLFLKGGHPTLKQNRREQLFVEILEAVHPADAKLLCLLKDKKLPEGLTPAIIKKAFPNIVPPK